MAAPQTHGLASISIIFVFILLAVLGLAAKITFWEFISALFFGVGIDFLDHFSLSYLKDIPARVKRGRGMPAKDVKILVPWLHLWPGLILVGIWTILFRILTPSFRIYLPFIFWVIHIVVDRFQKNLNYDPHRSFWYPFSKKTYIPKHGYPIKPASEFIIDSALWMAIAFVLLGLLILK